MTQRSLGPFAQVVGLNCFLYAAARATVLQLEILPYQKTPPHRPATIRAIDNREHETAHCRPETAGHCSIFDREIRLCVPCLSAHEIDCEAQQPACPLFSIYLMKLRDQHGSFIRATLPGQLN